MLLVLLGDIMAIPFLRPAQIFAKGGICTEKESDEIVMVEGKKSISTTVFLVSIYTVHQQAELGFLYSSTEQILPNVSYDIIADLQLSVSSQLLSRPCARSLRDVAIAFMEQLIPC